MLAQGHKKCLAALATIRPVMKHRFYDAACIHRLTTRAGVYGGLHIKVSRRDDATIKRGRIFIMCALLRSVSLSLFWHKKCAARQRSSRASSKVQRSSERVYAFILRACCNVSRPGDCSARVFKGVALPGILSPK